MSALLRCIFMNNGFSNVKTNHKVQRKNFTWWDRALGCEIFGNKSMTPGCWSSYVCSGGSRGFILCQNATAIEDFVILADLETSGRRVYRTLCGSHRGELCLHSSLQYFDSLTLFYSKQQIICASTFSSFSSCNSHNLLMGQK